MNIIRKIQFLNLNADTFSRTLENMQKRNPKLYLDSMPLISAKLALEVPDQRLNYIFQGDKLSVAVLTEEISKQVCCLTQFFYFSVTSKLPMKRTPSISLILLSCSFEVLPSSSTSMI